MKNNPLPAPDLRTLPGPETITQAVLSNGITLLVRANPSSPSVFIGGHIPCGALFDPAEKLGLANFTSLALMRGTDQRSFQQIYDLLETNAASLSFGGGTHTIGFSGRALSEDLPLLLDLLKEALLSPIFPREEIERLRTQLLTGLAIRAQDTAEMASITFDQIVFEGHPYALPEDGWSETISRISREDLETFHRRHYSPAGMVLAIVGAVVPQKTISLVEKILGGWNNPEQPAPPPLPAHIPLQQITRRRYEIPGKVQSDLLIGASGPLRKDPDFMSASLGNSVLGQFGLGGRIGDAVREKAGLAYYAYSSLNAGVGPGSWAIHAGVNPKNLNKTIDLITHEVKRFLEKGIEPEELADSQSNYIGRLPLSFESNAGMVGALLNIERYSLGLDYYQRYPDLVRAVTPRSVQETASRYLNPHRLAIAVAGP